MATLIEVKNLSKNFNSITAVDNISFGIKKGCCFGLLGPNGAGKSTTIEIMEGIKNATSGEIIYKGSKIDESFRAEAGIMFQRTALQEYITVRESLNLFKRFYTKSIPIETLIQRCSLEEFLDRDTNKLSGGQLQRVLLAIALINDPDIIFLDEPTTGLDPQSRRNFWQLIKDIIASRKTVLLTTHYMDEAFELCDEIAIMDHGKIIAQGSPRELLDQHYNDVVLELPLNDDNKKFAKLEKHCTINDNILYIATDDITATIQRLIDNAVPLDGLNIRARTLDDLFLKLTGKALRL